MEPLAYRREARPGQTITFRFRLHSSDKPLHLEVQPVSLVQHRDGRITVDERAAVPRLVRLSTPSRIDLVPQSEATIEGTWTLPAGAGQFYAVGLLVTDRTDQSAFGSDQRPQMGVRFVTRYLLRVEADIRQVRPQVAVRLTGGRLIDRDGFAHAQVLVSNPVGAGQRFEARGRLLDADGRVVMDRIPLGLPVRANQPKGKRSEVIVLPSSQVVLQGRLPDPVYAGEYRLQVSLHQGTQRLESAEFALAVSEDQFPAQRSVVARVLKAVDIQPPELELSTLRRGSRMLPLSLENKGTEPIAIRLRPIDGNGEVVPWLKVRPQTLTLQAGRRRNVMVALQVGGTGGPPALQTDRYAHLSVEAVGQHTASRGTQYLPVAWLGKPPSDSPGDDPQAVADAVRLGPLRLTPAEPSAAVLQLALENQGTRHVTPHLHIRLEGPGGESIQRQAGYHRWVLPGGQRTYKFPIEDLRPGTYRVQIDRIRRQGAAPIRTQQTLRVR